MNKNRYIKILNLIKGKDSYYAHAIAQSISMALDIKYKDLHKKVICNTGVSVIGPVFFLFVKWTLEKALEKGLERLYFFARDGQLLVEIAKIISKSYGYDIPCQYIYASRQALLFPAMEKIGDDEIDWMLSSTVRDHSIQEIFNRFNLEPAIISEELISHGLPENLWKKPIHWGIQKKLEECLKNPETIKKILQHASEYRKDAIGYFKQEGLFENGNFAIVDIGWTGSSLNALYKILHGEGWNFSKGITGLFFSLQTENLLSDTVIPYFYDSHPWSRKRRLANRVLLEVFAQADHGMTLGYQKKVNSDQYYPILSNSGIQSSVDWGVRLQQQGALEFVKCFTKLYPKKNSFQGDGVDIVEKLLTNFLEKPTFEESNVYGKCIFAEEQTEKDLSEIAPIIKKKDFFIWLFGFKSLKKNFFYWIPASLNRSRIKPIRFFNFIIRWRVKIFRCFKNIIITLKVVFVKLIKKVFPGFVAKLKEKGIGY